MLSWKHFHFSWNTSSSGQLYLALAGCPSLSAFPKSPHVSCCQAWGLNITTTHRWQNRGLEKSTIIVRGRPSYTWWPGFPTGGLAPEPTFLITLQKEQQKPQTSTFSFSACCFLHPTQLCLGHKFRNLGQYRAIPATSIFFFFFTGCVCLLSMLKNKTVLF